MMSIKQPPFRSEVATEFRLFNQLHKEGNILAIIRVNC